MSLSRNIVFCALVLGFLGSVNARALTQTEASCSVSSFLEIIVTEGTCKGSAEVTCQAQAESQSAVKVAIEEWFADDHQKLCAKESIEAAALAVGKAVARVYAQALVNIDCSDDAVGSACGWSFGTGDAWAIATARAIAIAVADLGPDTALCETDITALSGVFVDAGVTVGAAACSTGPGSASDNESAYVEAVRFAIADAFAYASAEFCNAGSEVFARSTCAGEAGSRIDGSGGTGGRIPACPGVSPTGDATCCSDRFLRRSTCNCRDCNGPWFRIQRKANGGLDVWEDISGNPCFCV